MSNEENSLRESLHVSLCTPVGLSCAMPLDVARKKLIEFANSRLVYPSLGRVAYLADLQNALTRLRLAALSRSMILRYSDFSQESDFDLISKTGNCEKFMFHPMSSHSLENTSRYTLEENYQNSRHRRVGHCYRLDDPIIE